MNGHFLMRTLLSLAAAGGLVFGSLESARPHVTAAAGMPSIAHTTLRIGMWTLWHDREVVLTPAGLNRKITLRVCDGCVALTFTAPIRIEAAGDTVALTVQGKAETAKRMGLTGAFTLTAHGETVMLENPVVIVAHAGVLEVVITLPVESYVERVVASESGPGDSAESLRALAVVVRTFALHESHGHAEYDLCDSTHCQLLHWGRSRERQSAAHTATLATAGETLWFHGQRALGYFSKDCGGQTASPAEIWTNAQPAPYLTSRMDRYCTADGGREWAAELTRAELTAALASHGLARPGWQKLTVARRGESGRAVTLRLDQTEISAESFRMAVGESLGWNRVPSTWFEVAQQGDRFELHGRGWGHGVGLCQKGAASMAAQGNPAREILSQYFPGATAADEETGAAWKTIAGSGFVLESLDASDSAYLPDLNRARAEAQERSGLNVAGQFTVRSFASAEAFRNATLAPGWVAAFTEGQWIGVQPLRTLAARGLLAETIRHEFLHALVETEAGAQTPLWLREGLVEAWARSGDTADPLHAIAKPALGLDATETALAHAASETQSEAAHRSAAWYAEQLLNRYGRAQVLEWLKSGVPAGVVAAFSQR